MAPNVGNSASSASAAAPSMNDVSISNGSSDTNSSNISSSSKTAASLSSSFWIQDWPWKKLGPLKFALYAPVIVNAFSSAYNIITTTINSSSSDGISDDQRSHPGIALSLAASWHVFVLLLLVLRVLQGHLWMTLSRWHSLVQRIRIQTKGVDFDQVDREENWTDVFLLHSLLLSAAPYWLPPLLSLPLFNIRGIALCLACHLAFVEPTYYCLHRALHSNLVFSNCHSRHHASVETEPVTAFSLTATEHLLFTLLFAIPLALVCSLGFGSFVLFYAYILGLDCLDLLKHCNFEPVPSWLFQALPPLRHFVMTPTFHALHHSSLGRFNFALSLPLLDFAAGTAHPQTLTTHASVRQRLLTAPDFVFLAHGTTHLSVFHLAFALPHFASHPFHHPPLLFLLSPLALLALLFIRLLSPTILAEKLRLRGKQLQTWIIPRIGIQYFLPFEQPGINQMIEEAIVDADKMGVKVFTLGALNKNEALNGGGVRFVQRLPSLSLRLVHGNTLTAGAILDKIPRDVREVFLSGATSKLGRAIALYLSRRGVRVLMLTSSKERFEAIQLEAEEEHRKNLIRCTKVKDGANCKEWVVGRFLSAAEQGLAPAGTHFHQFVVPPLQESRRDCSYGQLAAMRLPQDVEGLKTCEMTMPRGCVHACHAGGLVHLLEGWDHHEVGAIDPDRIDVVWEAAMRQGFRAV